MNHFTRSKNRVLQPGQKASRMGIILMFLCQCWSLKMFGQQAVEGGKIYHFSSSFTSFPDPVRSKGYYYDSVYFDYPSHYMDSSVIAVIPNKWSAVDGKVDFIFWFHGWHNNIDSALSYYHLSSQFLASGRNAILVLAETAKNAPDSYGGKLEKQNDFKDLLQDVLANLRKRNIISPSCQPNNIILAGHSGAYRVIANILQNGGVAVREVDLFDAMYGETEKFLAWIKKDESLKFINFFTNTGGGTDEVSAGMMKDLKEQKIDFVFVEEKDLNSGVLQSGKLLFIHSTRAHNDIIFNPDRLREFLENSPILKPIE